MSLEVALRQFSDEASPGRVVFGVGAARTELTAELNRRGATRILLITAGSSEPPARSLVEPFADRVTERAARRGAVAGDAGVSRQASQQASGRGPRRGV